MVKALLSLSGSRPASGAAAHGRTDRRRLQPDPGADATWDEAWKTSDVDLVAWQEIRDGLRDEAHRWLKVLKSGRDVTDVEFTGMIASIAHFGYHLGAIRQISKDTRGPTEGTF